MGWGDWGTAQHLGFLSSFLNAPNPNNTQLLIILLKKTINNIKYHFRKNKKKQKQNKTVNACLICFLVHYSKSAFCDAGGRILKRTLPQTPIRGEE